MVEKAEVPDRGYLKTGGKSIETVIFAETGFGPNARTVAGVVTDDWTVYEFARLRDGEPFRFQRRIGPDGSIDTALRRLPECVQALARADDVLYT